MKIERNGNTYTARDDQSVVWQIEMQLDAPGNRFREELWWPAAGIVAIGAGSVVYFLADASGDIVSTLALEGDHFGHFGPADDEVLYILGWCDVVAVDSTLAIRWVSKDVAVDGIVWREKQGDHIALMAEMDPPGGWVEVELDARTGEQLHRGRE